MQVPSAADESVTSKCINCGAAITPTAKFCSVCGATQAVPPEQVGEDLPDLGASRKMQKALRGKFRTLAFCWLAYVALNIVILWRYYESWDYCPANIRFIFNLGIFAEWAFVLSGLIAAIGLLTRQMRGRTASIIASFLNIVQFPVGTAIGIWTFVLFRNAQKSAAYQDYCGGKMQVSSPLGSTGSGYNASSTQKKSVTPNARWAIMGCAVIFGSVTILGILIHYAGQNAQTEATEHYNHAANLVGAGDLTGGKLEYQASIAVCSQCPEAKNAKEQLKWIEPAIAAGWTPQYEESKREQDPAYGEHINYTAFFAKAHTGLPIGKRYRFDAILSQSLCIKSNRTYNSQLLCGTRADFDNRLQYELLLSGPDNVSGTIVASMAADGTIDIHSFR